MNSSLADKGLKSLKQTLGAENISLDMDDRILFSQDIWAKGNTADFIMSPQTTEQLSDAVRLAARNQIRLNPRGGGMSYTKGYTPSKNGTAIIDFSKMNNILEINCGDMYVTVQAGCTWQTLNDALRPMGLRTPFWGALSGANSTIGGGVSQNNAFFGASTHGPSVDSVTCLTIVLADGTILKTGSAGTQGAKPFFRQYGPDLTGLFLADCGAMGYKAEITLRLIPLPNTEDWASFGFDDRDDWATALVEIGRLGIACELFGFDPNLQTLRMQRESMAADVKRLANVVTKQKGGLLKGIKEGAKVAMAGRSVMNEFAYSLHYIVEGHSQVEVTEKMKSLAKIARNHGGHDMENSVPKIIRSNPFGPLNSIVGPKGERHVPMHGIVPMSAGKKCVEEIEAIYAEMQDEIEKHGVTVGYFLGTLSNNGCLVEPMFLWPAEIMEIHKHTVDPGILKRIKFVKPDPEAIQVVKKIRQDIMDIFNKYGAAHLQIGRTYPYREFREKETWRILDGIKSLLDPNRSVNSGSLGFD